MRGLRSEEVMWMDPHDGMSVLIRRERDQNSLSPSPRFSRSQPREDTTKWPPANQEVGPHRIFWHLDFGPPASRTVRNKCLGFVFCFLFFKPFSLVIYYSSPG